MANDVKLKLAVEGGQVVSQTIDGVTKRLEAMGGTAGIAKNMLAGMATGLSVAAFTAYARAAIDAADAMNDLSQRVGISVRELAKYELAAAQSGTTLEALAKGVKGIAVNLADYGDALKKAGITATTADGAMRQIADVFAAMPDGMEKTTLAVKLFGKSGMDMIPMLNLGSAGLQDAAEKSAAYAEQMALLAPLADAFNDNLATLAIGGKTLGLTLVNEVMPSLAQISAALAESDGTAAGFAKTLGSTLNITLQTAAVLASDVAFVLKGMGREIGGIIAQFNALGEGGGIFSAEGRAAWVAVGDAMKEDAERARLELDRWQQQLLAGPQANQNAYNKRQGFGEKEYTDPLAQYKAILAALKEQNSAASDAEKIAKARAAAEKKAIEEATKTAQSLANIRNKEADDIDAYMRAESARLADTARASEDAVRAAQDEYDNHGKLQSAIAETTLARLQDQLINKTAGTEAYASIARQVEAQRQLINILKNGEARDAAEDAAKALADANRKAAEESSKYWEDALMRAFESGKGFFDSLWSTIKNTLKTQVLKVLVTGSLTSMGLTGAASATTSTLSGVSALGSLANLPTAISGLATAVTSLPSLLMSSSMGALDIAGFAMAGPAGWALAAAAAVAAIFGNRKTPSAGTGEGAINFDATGAAVGQSSRYSGSWGLTSEVEKSIQGVSSAYMAAAASLGIGTVATQFAFGGNTGKEGKDPQFALGVNAGGVSYSSGEIQLNDANVQLAASRAVFAALQGSELPAYLVDLFNGIDASTATQDQISAVYDYAAQLKNVRDGLSETREPLQILQDQVSAGTAALATSADTFTADFIAAIDAGISPARLAQWQALGTALDQLAANAAETAAQVAAAAAALQADIYSAQDDAMSAYMSAQADYAAIVAGEQEAAAQAMQAAAVATADAAESIRSALASAGAGIATLIRDLTTTAGGTLDPMALARSTQAAYFDDLRRAQGGDVDASGRVASSARAYLDASGAVSAGSRQAATVAQVVRELGQLPAVKTYEQQLLEAVQGTTTAVTTSSASNASTIAAALSTKLIAELSITAQSEILKLVNFVSNTDQLPDDLKALALADASTFSKTISFVQGSTLTAENKQLALLTTSELVKTYNFVAAAELTADQKLQAFGALGATDRVIRVVTGSLLSDDAKHQAFDALGTGTRTVAVIADSAALASYKQIALDVVATGTKTIMLAAQGFSSADAITIANASAGVTKAVALALGAQDANALALLNTQQHFIQTTITAAGGVLTADQQTLLNGLASYYKNVSIGVTVDQAGLTAAQALINSLFGNVNILANAASGTTGVGGLTVAELIGQAEIDRLASINRYINTLDFSAAGVAASVAALNAAAVSFGASINDIANASGYTVADLQALGVAGVSTTSSVASLGSNSSTAANSVSALASNSSTAAGILATYQTGYVPTPTKFAEGGVFTNSVITNPTPFNLGLMGEAGPEAIMPLHRGADGALGVLARLQSPQANSAALADGLKAMAAELAAVRAELAAIKANTNATAVHTANTADSTRTMERDGLQVWTDPAEPINTVAAA